MNRKQHPSNVSDDEWAFVALYLTLMKEEAPQGEQVLCKGFNGARCCEKSQPLDSVVIQECSPKTVLEKGTT